jgi:hypothetical protein
MEIPTLVGGARSVGNRADKLPVLVRLRLHIAKGERPVAVGQPDRVPELAVQIEGEDMEIPTLVGCTRDITDEPYIWPVLVRLRLHTPKAAQLASAADRIVCHSE